MQDSDTLPMTTKKSTTARVKSAARPVTGAMRTSAERVAKVKSSAAGHGAAKSTEKKQAVAKTQQKPRDAEEIATETRPVGARGGRIGRPKTRLEDLEAVPTRCPAHIYTYLKGITPFLYP